MEVEESTIINTEQIEANQEIIEIEENDYGYSSEDEIISNNNKKGCRLHTIKSKIKIINYAENHTIKETVIKYNVPRTTLNDFSKIKINFYL